MNSWLRILLLVVLGCAYGRLGFDIVQSDFQKIITGYTIGFAAYAVYIWRSNDESIDLVDWIGIAILPIILTVSFPQLSDDLYRFIWDGYCLKAGISPYAELPSVLVQEGVNGLDQELFNQLNSPEYYSIYPAISQASFYLTVSVSNDLIVQSMTLSLIYYALHIIGAYCLYLFLKKNKMPTSLMLLYYLNPLVVVEGIGNLHAEVNMVSFLFMSLYFFDKRRDWISATFFAAAIAIKMIPLFLLGYFLVRYRDPRMLWYLIKIGIMTALLFVPVIYGLVAGGFLDSIDLYFRKFEFNGSIYYLLRSVGQWVSGYNLIAYIGPALFLGFVIHSFFRWIRNNSYRSLKSFVYDSEVILMSYFLISTIVHPWYVIGLLGLNIFLQRKYLVVWSYLITLTYINYAYPVYHENLWVVALEYTLVLIVYLYERGSFGVGKDKQVNRGLIS